MVGFLDVCKFTAVSAGTGDFVVSANALGYQTPANAGAVNGTTYRYRAESTDLTQWEVGYGVYTTGSVTLARTTVLFNSLGTTAKISFTAAPNVGVVLLAEDVRALVNTVVVRPFTASGTYTPTTGMLFAIIEGVGGGGGGGGVTGDATHGLGGGGGGAGSYSRKIASAAAIGVSQTVTIGAAGTGSSGAVGGAGGDTSVGSLCIGKGGGGGTASSAGSVGVGGAGGVAGTGDFTPAGASGITPSWTSGTLAVLVPGGSGAASFFGGGASGALGVNTGPAQAGANAANYGAGGAGASVINNASNAAGGNGSAGAVVITEFCSQ